MSRPQLWRRLALLLASPWFHGRFMYKRVCGSVFSKDRTHNLIGFGVWGAVLAGGALTHTLVQAAVIWVLPVTVLLQIATVFRILCEHRLPSEEVIEKRGRDLVCEATAGVFAGVRPPARSLPAPARLAAWGWWWANMLTVQVFCAVVRAGRRCAMPRFPSPAAGEEMDRIYLCAAIRSGGRVPGVSAELRGYVGIVPRDRREFCGDGAGG